MAVSYNALPNIEYNIWFTESMEQPWQLLDTVPPTDLSTVINTYSITNATGFFKTTGYIVDPATD